MDMMVVKNLTLSEENNFFCCECERTFKSLSGLSIHVNRMHKDIAGKILIKYIRQFVESVDGYKLLSDAYINSKTILEIQCIKCHKFKMRWDCFQQGQRCPICCNESKRLSISEVKKYIESFKDYKLLCKDYINNKTNLNMICPYGHVFKMNFDRFQQGQRCPVCYGNKKKTIEEIREFVESKEYKLLSDTYINNSTKLDMICPDGHIFKMCWNNFMFGNRCPVCYGNKKKTIEEIRKYVEQEGYILLSKEYINSHSNLEIKCSSGHVFKMNWTNFSSGKRCPKCKRSKGEEIIAKILESNYIEFETQKRFDECKNILHLPFDFYIPSLNILIEYDGEQHFKPFSFSSNRTQETMNINFINIMLRDEIKTNFASSNNIKLLRISYYNFYNIEEIIKKHLNIWIKNVNYKNTRK